MLQNFVKVIFRCLSRSRFFTFLNILGLSIGTSCCIVIYLFIQYEMSYDDFHVDKNIIYRVIRQSEINGMPYNIGITSAPFAPALKQDYPERINDITRAMPIRVSVQLHDKIFAEDRFLLADENFFNFFSYPLLKGNPSDVLNLPNSLVVSKALAKKYFGNDDPIGKFLRVENELDLVITGVMDDPPGHSHLQFDAVVSMLSSVEDEWFNDWWSNTLNTYVKVASESEVTFLNQHFPSFMDKYFGDDFERVGNKVGLKLEALKDIYFNYDTRYERNIVHGDKRYIFVFGSMGILLIILAAINYINLATAQADKRAREVGIRKTMGSSRFAIITQFLSESFLLCFLALFAGIIITQLAVPIFNSAFGTSLPDVQNQVGVWIFMTSLLVVLTILAGSYPAFLLSSFKPVSVLKGQTKSELQYLFLRRGLVVFQFCISLFMIITALFIDKQLTYMKSKDLGFITNNVAVVRLNNRMIGTNIVEFKDRILPEKYIESVSISSGYPGGFYDATTIRIQDETKNIRMRTLFTDEDYLNTLNIGMIAGRFFSKDIKDDGERSVVMNETAIKEMGWTAEEALGKRIQLAQFDSIYKEVVGVVEDYHFTSLKEKIEPLVISYGIIGWGNLLVRFEGNDFQQQVEIVQHVWDSYETGFPLQLSFLDDVVNQLYSMEEKQGRIFKILSVISVLIASLGVLGLASYLTVQRKKEIGIRKVLGASVSQVSFLLMKDLVILVVVAIAITIPIGYWAINQWSQSFAYRTTVGITVFAFGSGIVLLIALLIVGANALRAAAENPVIALRTE